MSTGLFGLLLCHSNVTGVLLYFFYRNSIFNDQMPGSTLFAMVILGNTGNKKTFKR